MTLWILMLSGLRSANYCAQSSEKKKKKGLATVGLASIFATFSKQEKLMHTNGTTAVFGLYIACDIQAVFILLYVTLYNHLTKLYTRAQIKY